MASDATWGPPLLAVALFAVGAAWLGTGMAGAHSDPSDSRPASDNAVLSPRSYDQTLAAAVPSSPAPVSASTIDELQIGLGGGTILLLGTGGVLLVRGRAGRVQRGRA
jgi:hypothetical protein